LELEKARDKEPNGKLTGRALYFQLLPEDITAKLLAHQNEVIGRLDQPPASHVDLYPSVARPQYLSYFERQVRFDAVKSWLRFRNESDIGQWIELLKPFFPVLNENAQAILEPDVMHLGKGNLLRGKIGGDSSAL
jgi:hypothetical protein